MSDYSPQPIAATETPGLQALLDRSAITQVVNDWGLSRDTGRWDNLKSCYTHDATMHTTWFVGTAAEFVERSMDAAKKGARAQHFIGAASIELQGHKAIAETRMILLVRGMLDGVEVDVTCYGRFYDWFVKLDGEWRIQQRVPIYEKDRLEAVDPGAMIKLNQEELVRHPDGYRHLAYLQSRGGAIITADLPTPNSAALARLYAEGGAWLAAGPVSTAGAS
jgi:hypothetical protein